VYYHPTYTRSRYILQFKTMEIIIHTPTTLNLPVVPTQKMDQTITTSIIYQNMYHQVTLEPKYVQFYKNEPNIELPVDHVIKCEVNTLSHHTTLQGRLSINNKVSIVTQIDESTIESSNHQTLTLLLIWSLIQELHKQIPDTSRIRLHMHTPNVSIIKLVNQQISHQSPNPCMNQDWDIIHDLRIQLDKFNTIQCGTEVNTTITTNCDGQIHASPKFNPSTAQPFFAIQQSLKQDTTNQHLPNNNVESTWYSTSTIYRSSAEKNHSIYTQLASS
jgi:hypothetical protein